MKKKFSQILKILLVGFLLIESSSCNFGTKEDTKPTVSTPTFSLSSGKVFSGAQVEIKCDTDGATIYYTVDGTEPTNQSNKYSLPLRIVQNVTIKAIAEKDGMNPSEIAQETYWIETAIDPLDDDKDDTDDNSNDDQPDNQIDNKNLDGIYVYTVIVAEQPYNYYTWIISGNDLNMYQATTYIDDNYEVEYNNYLNTTIKKKDLSFTIQNERFEDYEYTLKTDSTGTFLSGIDLTGENQNDPGKLYKVATKEDVSVPQGYGDVYWKGNIAFVYEETMNEKKLKISDEEGLSYCEAIEVEKNGQKLTVDGVKYREKNEPTRVYSDAFLTATIYDDKVIVDSAENFPTEIDPEGTYVRYIRKTPWLSIDGKEMKSTDDGNSNKKPDDDKNGGSKTCPFSGDFTYSNSLNTFDVTFSSDGSWIMNCTSGEVAKGYSIWSGNEGVLYETEYKSKTSSSFESSSKQYEITYNPETDTFYTRGWTFERK